MSHLVNTSLPYWFALRTRSRHEKVVRDRLEGSGFEQFLPLTRTLRRWSDRNTWTEFPLFSGYCFARFAWHSRLDVLRIPGIINIVGIEGPEPIPEEELNALKTVSKSRRACDSHAYLNEGAWVQVVRGPLTGLKGRFIRKAGQDCIVLRVQMLQQAAAVHIDASEVVGVC